MSGDAEVTELRAALERADETAEGDSNDDEIDALRFALDLALSRWPEVDEPRPDDEYEITISNVFTAGSFEDAVGQMATYVSDQAYQAGYRVKNLRTGEDRFVDAEDVDWDTEESGGE